MALFWSLFTGRSYLVDFLKNEIIGFDENLAVVLLSATMCYVAIPEAFVCERHQETLTWSPMQNKYFAIPRHGYGHLGKFQIHCYSVVSPYYGVFICTIYGNYCVLHATVAVLGNNWGF